VPLCLRKSWIVENFKEDSDAIIAFFNTTIDRAILEELKTASSLLAASNVKRTPNIEILEGCLQKEKINRREIYKY